LLDEWQAKILSEFDKCIPGLSKTVTGLNLYRWGHAIDSRFRTAAEAADFLG
jgi:hypothetical protein